MATKHDSARVRRVLTSKKPGVLKPRFTRSDRAILIREQQRLVDAADRKVVGDITRNVLAPWHKVIKDAGSSRRGEGEALARASEVVRSRSMVHEARPPIPAGISDPHLLLPAGGSGAWTVEPPYDAGYPEVERVTQTVSPRGGPGTFVATSELAIPAEGLLSIGVGVGRFLDLYPAPLEDRFGDGNQVSANLCHYMVLPGPVAVPSRVDVTARVRMDAPYPHTYLGPTSGGSIEDGPVWVMGTVHLTVWSLGALGEPTRTASRQFLIWMKTNKLGCFYCDYSNAFDLSASLVLNTGADGVGVTIEARLRAFLTGRLENLTSGFAGVDFRDHYRSHGIWLLEPGGGPIKVPRLTLVFCPV